VTVGTTVDVSISAAQVEKGAFATSYTPTTTAAVTRNADVVTVPTTNWSAAAGTVSIVAGDSSGRTGCGGALKPSGSLFWSGTGYIETYEQCTSSYIYMINGATAYNSMSMSAGYHVRVGGWNTGSNIGVFVDGVAGTPGSTCPLPTGMSTVAYLGREANSYYFNGPIQRLAVYSSALSSSDVSTVTNAVQNGP
jgi:hypothetical protein